MMPNTKVAAGALAGALSVILVWLIPTVIGADAEGKPKVEIPAEIASAITTVLTFLVSYFVPEKEKTA